MFLNGCLIGCSSSLVFSECFWFLVVLDGMQSNRYLFLRDDK